MQVTELLDPYREMDIACILTDTPYPDEEVARLELEVDYVRRGDEGLPLALHWKGAPMQNFPDLVREMRESGFPDALEVAFLRVLAV